MLLNCGVGEDSWESLDCRESQPVHPKGNQSWIFVGRTDAEVETPNTLATWCKELTHWKRPWCGERLKVGGEGDDRGWEGLASLTQWTWVWVNSRSWPWTGRPGMLHSMGSQSWTQLSNWTELNWTEMQSQRILNCRTLGQLSSDYKTRRISPPNIHLESVLKL